MSGCGFELLGLDGPLLLDASLLDLLDQMRVGIAGLSAGAFGLPPKLIEVHVETL
jgi:hypothetical protein